MTDSLAIWWKNRKSVIRYISSSATLEGSRNTPFLTASCCQSITRTILHRLYSTLKLAAIRYVGTLYNVYSLYAYSLSARCFTAESTFDTESALYIHAKYSSLYTIICSLLHFLRTYTIPNLGGGHFCVREGTLIDRKSNIKYFF